MATLTAQQRSDIGAALQRWWSRVQQVCAFTKPELSAAIDATDSWIDTNAAAYNLALPLGFRTKASAFQKTILFCWVAIRRAKRDGAAVTLPGENS